MAEGAPAPVFDASVVHGGFRYSLVADEDGATAALVGSVGATGDAVVPRTVELNGTPHLVTRITVGAIEGGFLDSIAIPDTVTKIDDGAFSKARYLKAVEVAEGNPTYSSYDGMLFDAERTSLLLIPEGKQGAARIPKTASSVPPDALSHCASVTSVEVEAGSAAYSSWNGCLYDAPGETLLRVPAGLGNEAVVAEGCTQVASGAFEGCGILFSLVSPRPDLAVVSGESGASVAETEEALRGLTRDEARAGTSPTVDGAKGSAALGVGERLASQALLAAAGVEGLAARVAAPTPEASQAQGEGLAAAAQSFSVAFDLDKNPSHEGVAGTWPQGYAPPSSLQPDSGDVLISNPIRTGYRFLGWGNSPRLIERRDGGQSVIHAAALSGDVVFVACWSFNVSVDVPSVVSFSYENAPEGLGTSSEGAILEGAGLSTSFVNRSNACSLRVVGLSSEASADAPLLIRAKPESGRTDEEALQLQLLSMYPTGHGDDDARVVSFRLQDMVGEERFGGKDDRAFLIPKGDAPQGFGELEVSYRLNLDNQLEGQPEPNFAMVDGSAALESPKGLARLSYVIATAASQDGPASFEVVWNGRGGYFDGDREKEVAATAVANSMATEAPDAGPERPGYSLKGWAASEEEAERGQAIGSFPQITVADAEYFAIWEGKERTVWWNANTGAALPGEETQQNGRNGDLLAPPKVRKEGYTHLGWSTRQDATKADEGLDLEGIAERVIDLPEQTYVQYYAVWAKTPMITWDAMGGAWEVSGGEPAKTEVTEVPYGTPTEAPSPNPSRYGYAFGGWAWSQEDAWNKVQCQFHAETTADKTYYAIWNPKTFTIWWNTNAANTTVGETQQTLRSGDLVEPPAVTKVNHTLLGWTTSLEDPEGEGQIWIGSSDIASTRLAYEGANLFMFAYWVEDPKLTWDANGGRWRDQNGDALPNPGSYATRVPYGSGAEEPALETGSGTALLARPGYVLKGWATKPESTEVTSLPGKVLKAQTFYACWEQGPSATGIEGKEDLYLKVSREDGSGKSSVYGLEDIKRAAQSLSLHSADLASSPFYRTYKEFLDDKKAFRLKLGSAYWDVLLLGICQDREVTGIAAGLTFGFRDLYAYKDVTAGGTDFQTSMNESDSNRGGWSNAGLRNRLQTDFYAKLGNGMKSPVTGIVAVAKTQQYVEATSSSFQTQSDKVFIPSLYEVYGICLGTANPSEGVAKPGSPSYYAPFQYQYFASAGQGFGNSLAEKTFDGKVVGWWLRSVRGGTNGFCMSGAGNSVGSGNSANSSTPLGVLPCFCL